MKKLSLVLFGTILLAGLIAMPHSSAYAGTDVSCAFTPTSGPNGTIFVATCTGFDPNIVVFAYETEPDGAVDAFGGFKTNSTGTVSISFFSNAPFPVASGTWTMTVEQLGLGHTVVHRGIASFRVTGGTEGVSGATLTVTPSISTKSDLVTVSGSGFAPFEIVSVWFDYPNDDCSTNTLHIGDLINFPLFNGIGTVPLGNVKADASGSFSQTLSADSNLCEGTYHFVARGNSSGRGGDAYATLTGNPVTETAELYVSPSSVSALFGTLTFSGEGFGAFEQVNCWITSPQGQVLPILTFANPKADAGGNFSFSIFTGSFFPGFPIASEGALGEWAMTCSNPSSGHLGIAHFTITGNAIDP